MNVSKCEMTAARTLEQAGEGGGNLPVILTTAQVQYIHTVRNKKVRRPRLRPPPRARLALDAGAACPARCAPRVRRSPRTAQS